MQILASFRRNAALFAATTFGFVMPAIMANAGEVALKSSDGTANILGEFVKFKDGNYIVRTDLANLSFAASRVNCEGADCPVIETVKADVHFVGSDTVGLGVMPLLQA